MERGSTRGGTVELRQLNQEDFYAIRTARAEPEGPTAVGTKKVYTSEFMGRVVKNTNVATIVDENRRVVYETTPRRLRGRQV